MANPTPEAIAQMTREQILEIASAPWAFASGDITAAFIQLLDEVNGIKTWHDLKIKQLNERYNFVKTAIDDNTGNMVKGCESIEIERRQAYREIARGILK